MVDQNLHSNFPLSLTNLLADEHQQISRLNNFSLYQGD